MSLFSTLAPGQGYGQGASAIQLHGMDSVMRKGGTGKTVEHAPISKSAAIRTMQDGFNIQNPSNIDLILRRKAPPCAESMRRNAAGTLPSERRNPDMPAVVRETSLEHTVHRRHSAPPARQQRGQENLMMRLATVEEGANRIGRSAKGRARSRSPDKNPGSVSPRREGRSRRTRSQSPRKPVFILQPWIVEYENYGCFPSTWGESHAFEGIANMPSVCEIADANLEMSPCDHVYNQNLEFTNTKVFKARSCSAWGSDDGRSTATGGSSPVRSISSSSFSGASSPTRTFSSSSFSECPTPSSLASGLAVHGLVDAKRCGEMYERRMKAMVKAAQKKALSKAGK